VLSTLGRDEEALKLVDEADDAIARLRAGGDGSDDTLLAAGRAGVVRGAIENNRGDFKRAINATEPAFAALSPLLARKDPPRAITAIAARAYRHSGFALARNGNNDAAIRQLAEARRLLIALGAKDPASVVDGAELVRTNWLYGESLRGRGQAAEARRVLREGIEVADGILARNPAHRPVLRAKASAVNQLARLEDERLQFNAALAINREAIGINESIAALEPKESRNNLRVSLFSTYLNLSELGRITERKQAVAATIRVDPEESLSGFALFNLVRWLSEAAVIAAEEGRYDDAKSLLERAVATSAEHARINSAKIDNELLRSALTMTRAQIQLLQRNPAGIEAAMAEPVAAVAALRATGAAEGSNPLAKEGNHGGVRSKIANV
jgi:tetratricopeptide (TPR) repeat protein